jgi:hypothetical protein
MMSLYGESGCPLWAAYSLGRGPTAPTSPDRVGGIGCGRFDRSWLLVMIPIPWMRSYARPSGWMGFGR